MAELQLTPRPTQAKVNLVPRISDDEALPEFRENWQRETIARAQEYWTAARTEQLAAGKALLLPPATSAPLLRALGLLHRDGSMPPKQVRKYWQVCHMVTLLSAQLRDVFAKHQPVRIVDVGCGRSYLTVVLAWIAKYQWQVPVQVLGIDRNADVIEECYRRVRLLQLDECVRFQHASVEDFAPAAAWAATFGSVDPGDAQHTSDATDTNLARAETQASDATSASSFAIHAVIALHACDTATCDALALAIRVGAELIAVAPCCQAEVARGWAAIAEAGGRGAFAAIWHTPHLRRETGADLTDAMRSVLLRSAGYQVSAIEFVPSEHTRKNTLIRAVRNPDVTSEARQAYLEEYDALVEVTGGVGIWLAERMRKES